MSFPVRCAENLSISSNSMFGVMAVVLQSARIAIAPGQRNGLPTIQIKPKRFGESGGEKKRNQILLNIRPITDAKLRN